MCADGLAAAKQQITSVKHTLETAAKTLTTVVALRRHSWLGSTSLSFATRALTEDLPFDRSGLFHFSTDATLQDLNKNIKTSRTLGVSTVQCPPRSCPTYCNPGLEDTSFQGPTLLIELGSSRPHLLLLGSLTNHSKSFNKLRSRQVVRQSRTFDCLSTVSQLSCFCHH